MLNIFYVLCLYFCSYHFLQAGECKITFDRSVSRFSKGFSFSNPQTFDYFEKTPGHSYFASAKIEANARITLSLKLREGESHSSIRGKDFIRVVVEEIFPEANYVNGYWGESSIQGDNFASFMTARAEGASIDEAAFETHTGKVLRALGFKGVRWDDSVSLLDEWGGIAVMFYRQEVQGDMDFLEKLLSDFDEGKDLVEFYIDKRNHLAFFSDLEWLIQNQNLSPRQAFSNSILGTEIRKAYKSAGYSLVKLQFEKNHGMKLQSLRMGFRRQDF